MTMSRTKLLETLNQLERTRRRLLKSLTQQEELAAGTVSVVYRKCGNPRCHCARTGEGHPQTLFLFKDEEEGRRRCKLIRKADEDRMQQAGERYREFREQMKQLRAIDRQEKQILMALMQMRAIRYE